jgi:hypothetical protein
MLGMNDFAKLFASDDYKHEKNVSLITNLSLSLTLHDTNGPSHDVTRQQKSSCPQKK